MGFHHQDMKMAGFIFPASEHNIPLNYLLLLGSDLSEPGTFKKTHKHMDLSVAVLSLWYSVVDCQ